MWPTISNIDDKITKKIKSYPDNLLNASKLNAWVRVFSGAVKNNKSGLIMESNTNWKLFNAAGEGGSSIYGSPQQVGTLGRDWTGKSVTVTGDRGMRPSPIITSLSSKEGQDQISRTCDFSITCYSLEQLEYLQIYFMEPGYSIGVEWGWNTIDGVKGIVSTESISTILTGIVDTTMNNKSLGTKRLNTSGEYDVFLGFIIGSTISNDGENFKIDVRLRGSPSLPTYLQSHRGTNEIDKTGIIINSQKVKRPYDDADMELYATDAKAIAKRRFAYMFNELPSFRQTIKVQELIDEVKYTQFINFDKAVEDEISNGINGGLWRSDSIKIEKDDAEVEIATEKLFSTNRYIKMDLAISILNTIGVIDKYNIGDKEITFKININNTIIGAFPYMFSTKADKLIIPGTLPDFLQYFLQLDTVEQLSGGATGGGFLKVNGNYKAPQKANDGIVSFVNSSPLNQFGLKEKNLFYGYLKDLYVNFDMFKSKIQQENKYATDVLLDILNEMSAAVNGFWNFQIVEGEFKSSERGYSTGVDKLPSDALPMENNPLNSFSSNTTTTSTNTSNTSSNKKTGDIEITVVDENWIGENPNPNEIAVFSHNGLHSPFLNSTLDVSIPAEMANMIIMKRNSGTSQPDMKDISVGGKSFFTSDSDLFMKPLDAKDSDAETAVDEEVELSEAQRKLAKLHEDRDRLITTERVLSDGVLAYYDKSGKLIKQRNSNGKIWYPLDKRIEEEYDIMKLQKAVSDELKLAEEAADAAALTSLTAFLDKLDIVPLSNISKLGVGKTEFTKIKNLTLTKMRTRFSAYCFDDTEYFNRLKNDAFALKYGVSDEKGLSHPLPIKYSFTILGNSGIRRGDTFNISGIPEKYKKSGLFQVMEVEHSLSGMKWETTITGQYRQMQ